MCCRGLCRLTIGCSAGLGAVAVVHNVFGVLENFLCAELHAHFDRVPEAIRGTSVRVADVRLSPQLSGDGFTAHVRVRVCRNSRTVVGR